jgi:hypothetical protein
MDIPSPTEAQEFEQTDLSAEVDRTQDMEVMQTETIVTETIEVETIVTETVEVETATGRPEGPVISQAGETAEKYESSHPSKHSAVDARFKGLFPPANGEKVRPASPHRDSAKLGDEDRTVSPALHPATTSLYIRDFMRPLQPTLLKNHLRALATPPSASPDPDIILDFFLDPIKTHCFVSFASISAASRVRTALHGTIYPDERTRKPLWVDFIPEDKVKEWIAIEQSSEKGGRGVLRWEVVYDDSDQGTTAVLQEAGTFTQTSNRNRDPPRNLLSEPPSGPRATLADRDMRQGNQQSGNAENRYGSGFKELDDRFLSTTAKPKLYYLPVPAEVSRKRLSRFAELARTGPKDRRGGDEMRRYTFEDTDFFVDRGAEYGSRGGRWGRGRGGQTGGGFGERGGWRDSNWRGRPR